MSDIYAPVYTTETQEKKPKEEVVNNKHNYCSCYVITHFIISFFAIYLSWKCNNGFNPLSFLAALCCPYLYIIFVLATRGGCGILDNESSIVVQPIRTINRF